MNLNPRRLLLAPLAALLLFASGPQVPAEAVPTYLQISGSNFSYGAQTGIKLRGINVTNGSATYEVDDSAYDINVGIAQGATFRSRITEDERDYIRYEQWQVNVLRFHLDWHWFGYLASDHTNFYAFMDQHIAWARTHHVWLIPTMAVPPGGWQDYTGHGMRFWQPGPTDPNFQNLLKDFWTAFATRYANEAQIAGYDLLNEPSSGAALPTAIDWWPYAGTLRNAIFAVDPNHFVVIEANNDGQFWERLPLCTATPCPPKYPNVVYSTHGYTPESMTHNGVFGPRQPYTYPGHAPDGAGVDHLWNYAELDRYQRVAGRVPITWALSEPVPLFIGEEGTVKQLEGLSYLNLITDQVALMNSAPWGTHWTFFEYRGPGLAGCPCYVGQTNFGVYNRETLMMTSDPAMQVAPFYDEAMRNILVGGFAGNIRPT
jgi:hypothetical protein